jgi:ceramide synthetase
LREKNIEVIFTCRCGTLVLVIHDFADIFLEAAKLCNYAKLATACDTIFGIFAVSWVITRLGVFPTWILYRLENNSSILTLFILF